MSKEQTFNKAFVLLFFIKNLMRFSLYDRYSLTGFNDHTIKFKKKSQKKMKKYSKKGDETLLEQFKVVSGFFGPFFKNMGWDVFALLVLISLIGASSTFMVWANGTLFDLIGSTNKDLILLLLVGIAVFFFVKGLARNRVKFLISTKLQDRMGIWKLTILRDILDCKSEMYQEMGSSQISERLNLKILGNFLYMAPGVITQVICGLIGLLFLGYKVPYLIPFTVIYMILYFVFCNKYGKRAATVDERHQQWSSTYSQRFKDSVIRFEDIHLQGIQDSVLNNLETTRIWDLKSFVSQNKLRMSFGNKITITTSIYSILTYVVATYLAVSGYLTVGELSMALVLNREVRAMTEELEWALSDELPALVVFVNRVNEMLDYGKQEYGGVSDEGSEPLLLVLDNIKFAYKKAGNVIKEVLNGISMILEEGKVYAIVGPSGSGKSTIAKIICRLLEAVSGFVQINGINIKKFSRKCLTKLVGMVSQKSLVFMGSIVDQFRYLPNFTWEKMEEVCKLVGLYNFIQSHPDGFLAKIGENGIKLSGGQLQRLAIAIVLLQDPKILIMDEATSAQDSETQALIYKNLEDSGFFKNKILIKIAHRLSTVCHSDKIFVLGNDGKFVGEGTHEYLIQKCEYYRNLVAFEKGDL